ncbi:DUF6069 family protein [Actinoplanes derwentensis]|uniref:Uncharacterized protein n=1 Tax=Actinoplanes derwentensis TaxID=113562 RepID=A0A1H1UXT8_9ACTN|nr:DUF6069 family protein [Actinoplanes derwentensis]GID89797.1 hypothetical protein Ade03nite_87210 [Actinoplanes derwentensis]SDS77325.1 hypothetical protein SAMN04489716_1581 [Actinoplanes derwentensis]
MTVATGNTALTGRTGKRLIVVVGAVLATVLVWAIGEPVLGHDLVVTGPGQPATDLGLSQIAFIAAASSLLGWAALAILERFTARALTVWTIAALLVLAVSFVPFLSVEATTGSKVVLALTHAVLAAVLIPGFVRTAAKIS